jgi:hypothetical protein
MVLQKYWRLTPSCKIEVATKISGKNGVLKEFKTLLLELSALYG